jgi:FKBP-type peptidyl-prolyl cis-trans isomerase SlyD
MQIQPNTVVSLHYSLKEGSENGELIEETFGSEPLVYLHGVGQMIAGFEANLNGKSAGEKYSFVLAPADAYGDINEEDIVTVPIENFIDDDGNLDKDALEVDAPIIMTDENGQQFKGIVAEVTNDTVKVDFNHPMSGLHLHFSGEIVEVRAASAEELDHGHVHGPGGHHH